jgi:hypothetical protein
MSFDLKAFVKKSWDTFRGGDTTTFNDPLGSGDQVTDY